MSGVLANAPLQLRVIAPVYFVPIAVLLVLLVQRELLRARPGTHKAAEYRVIDLAVLPLLLLFLLFAGLRVYTMIVG